MPEHAARPASDQPVRILAVDDDPQGIRDVRDTLLRHGFEPVVIGDPDEALVLVAEQSPALVLLDLVLPGIDGIELMAEIMHGADVPVIFLSSYGPAELIGRACEQRLRTALANRARSTTWSSRSHRRSWMS